MMTKINYQPWLQAVLMIAKHYRIEPSEERVRLQLDWNQNQNLDEILLLMCRQVGLHLRKVKFSDDVVNPWRLPVIVELNDGQVGVIDKADTEGNVSVQLSGDQGLSQKFAVGALKHIVKGVYIFDQKNQCQMHVLMNTSSLMKQAGFGQSYYKIGNAI
jgi:ATP-binding cassette subfamily C protein LapB